MRCIRQRVAEETVKLERLAWFLGGITLAMVGIAFGSPDDPVDSVATLDDLLAMPVGTASRFEQLVREAPASVTLVTHEEIERLGFRTLAEAIGYVRGFYLSYDRNYSYLGVRGFSRPTDYNNRILLLLNGHAMNENVYESAFLGNEFGLDLALVDRIEVVRGPGSALYGSTAVFAVVNVITHKGSDISGVKASLELGSDRLSRGGVLAGVHPSSGLDILASGQWFDIGGPDLYYTEFDTPENNNGIVRRVDWERGFGVAGMVSTGGWAFQGTFSSRSKGVPTASYGTRFNDGRSYTEDARWGVDLSYRQDLGVAAHMTGRLTADGYDYTGSFPYDWLQMDGSAGRWNGGEVSLQWDTHPFNRIDFGAEYTWNRRSDYRVWTESATLFSQDAPFDFGSLYFQNTTQVLANVSLSLAVRADHHSHVGWNLTPRLALVYNPWESGTIKGLYGEAFRAPGTFELYYAEPGVTRANPGLRHERIRTWEVTIEQRLSPVIMLYASWYNFTMRDLIDQVIDPVDSLSQYQNLSEAQAKGFEVELLARLKNGLTVSASAALQASKDAATGQRLSNSPETVLKMHCVIPFSESACLGMLLRYESPRQTVYGTSSEAFWVADGNITVNRIFDLFDVSCAVRNIFNSAYAYPGGIEHVQPAIPQDRRSISVRFDVNL